MKKILLMLLILLSVVLVGCGTPGDISQLKNLEQQEIFTQKEDRYYVFFYRDGCNGCEQTKPYILNYVKIISGAGYEDCRKIYGVNLTNKKNKDMYYQYMGSGGQGTKNNFWVDGVTNWADLRIGSTPALIGIYIKDGQKTARYVAQGREAIVSALNEQLAK